VVTTPEDYATSFFNTTRDTAGELQNGDSIRLVTMTPAGDLLFAGTKQLSSGRQVFGPDIRERVKAGDRIRVVTSRA
jgi:hypothetical protein